MGFSNLTLPGRSTRTTLTLVVLSLILAHGLLGGTGTTAAGAQPTTSLVNVGAAPVEPTDRQSATGSATGQGPRFSGQTEPSMPQRIADSLIWAWLLGVLIVGPVVWVWTGRGSASVGTGERRDEPASRLRATDG